MEYVVRIMPRAERDLDALYVAIRADESDAAFAWYIGLRSAILSLESSPNRCPMTSENKRLRHLLYGRGRNAYRIIFRVLESRREVEVLHIRYGARK